MNEKQIDEFKVIERDKTNQLETSKQGTFIGIVKKRTEKIKEWTKRTKDKFKVFNDKVKTDKNLQSKAVGTCVTIGVLLICVIGVVIVQVTRKPKTDLFSNVQVTFAGMSPEAYVVVQNNWEDEYLKDLTFEIDRPNHIQKGDTITVTVQASEEELKEHKIYAKSLSGTYQANQLDAYADSVSQVDVNLVSEIVTQCENIIHSETEDVTFRMIYKATGDAGYLREQNDERAEDIQLIHRLFLTQKNELEGEGKNHLVLLFQSNITNDNITVPVYFVFTFTDGYMTPDGSFQIDYDELQKKYQCSVDYEGIYGDTVGLYGETYEVTEIVQ